MGECACHPEIDSSFLCMKHNVYLCENCLTCRDPNIYCKYRSSCPIWFMDKRKQGWEREAQAEQEALALNVTFEPGSRRVRVSSGATLLEAAAAAEVHVNASCNGKGVCGKCRLVVTSGKVQTPATPLLSEDEQKRGYVLACQAHVVEDITVRIPAEVLEQRMQVAVMGKEATAKLKNLVSRIDPMLLEQHLELAPPTLDDAVSDLDRLSRGLKKQGVEVERLNIGLGVMRQLSEALRTDNWKVTADVIWRKCANEILAVQPGPAPSRALGLAIDVGTTTIEVYLVDMTDGAILAVASGHNRQAACGDDVINRIVCAEKDGVKKLSRLALATINGLIGETLDSVGEKAHSIKNIVVSGNTTMTHLLLAIEPRYIRRKPYIPTASEFPVLKAGDIGLKANPIAAVFIMPGPASYVGGDIVAGLLYAGFQRNAPLTLFIDVGTNGEIVVGNQEWLMTAACSAGPAFEGGGIRWGMRAEQGAIEQVAIDARSLEPNLRTVGGQAPRGICGSGMIDLICELLRVDVIDRSGRFTKEETHARVQRINGEWAYILAFADQTPMEADIVFTESDLKNLLYSKGAVYAGFTTLLREAGLDFSMVEQVVIAGGFGRYIDIEKAIGIGLLPDLARDKFSYLGNTSIAGAYLALLSDAHRQEAHQICNRLTYVDLSSKNSYMEEFTSALFLPHTNLEMFPSVV